LPKKELRIQRHRAISKSKTSTPQAFLVAVQDTSSPHACSAQGDQVGVQPSVYAWYRFADIKNGKPFLEL
jgi:hypothetical protein